MGDNIRRRLLSVGVAIGAGILLVGCYTVLNHPQVAPEQRVTDSGAVLHASECVGCHTEADIWEFHHGRSWLAPSHRYGYYYYRYDPYFLDLGWYSPHYYRRWVGYYHSPWWQYKALAALEPPAVGRGERRDDYDANEPRSEFVPLGGYGPGPVPTFSTNPIPLTSQPPPSATDRPAQDSTYNGRPVRVEHRGSSQPVATGSTSDGSASTQQKQAADDDEEDDQPRGRGDSRRGGSSQSR